MIKSYESNIMCCLLGTQIGAVEEAKCNILKEYQMHNIYFKLHSNVTVNTA